MGFIKSVLFRSCTRVNWPVWSAEPPSPITIRVEKVWCLPYLCIPITFRCVALCYCGRWLVRCVSKRGYRSLSRTQIGRVVVFNTHYYIASNLGMSRAMHLLPLLCRSWQFWGWFLPLLVLRNSKYRGFKRQTQMTATYSASRFSSHSIQLFILRLLLLPVAEFKVCNDLKAKTAQPVL
jgi:hypothetical protein